MNFLRHFYLTFFMMITGMVLISPVFGQAAITSGYFIAKSGSDTFREKMIIPLVFANQSPAIYLLLEAYNRWKSTE